MPRPKKEKKSQVGLRTIVKQLLEPNPIIYGCFSELCHYCGHEQDHQWRVAEHFNGCPWVLAHKSVGINLDLRRYNGE